MVSRESVAEVFATNAHWGSRVFGLVPVPPSEGRQKLVKGEVMLKNFVKEGGRLRRISSGWSLPELISGEFGSNVSTKCHRRLMGHDE